MPKHTMSAARVTTDHETIRIWVEERDGGPATVGHTKRSEPGILRIDFPGYEGKETLEPISWAEFFAKFDESGLAFLYQDETANGQTSRFSKFLKRDEIFAGEHPVRMQDKLAARAKATAKPSSTDGNADGARRARPHQPTRAAAKRGTQRTTTRAATAGTKSTTARTGRPQKLAGASKGRPANGRQSISPRQRKSR